MDDYRTGAGKVQRKPRVSYYFSCKEVFKIKGGHVKRTQELTQKTPTGPDNLNIKIHNDRNGL